MTTTDFKFNRAGTMLLVAATILVAISILLDGAIAPVVNGVAGITWFTAAGLLAMAAWRVSRRWELWLAEIVLTGLVAFVVTPSDFVPAAVGFGLAGMAVTLVARNDTMLWAKLVVALYLPFHIGTAVARAVARTLTGGEGTIRTDPPPTAAVVPLVMLAAALGGAFIVHAAMSRRGERHAGTAHELRVTLERFS